MKKSLIWILALTVLLGAAGFAFLYVASPWLTAKHCFDNFAKGFEHHYDSCVDFEGLRASLLSQMPAAEKKNPIAELVKANFINAVASPRAFTDAFKNAPRNAAGEIDLPPSRLVSMDRFESVLPASPKEAIILTFKREGWLRWRVSEFKKTVIQPAKSQESSNVK